MAIKVQNTTVIDDSRNIANAETINGITIGVKKPSIISPTDGSQEIGSSITFQSSPFRTSIGTDTHASSDWELATDSGFTNIVASSIDDTTNLTSITFSNLPADAYFVRVRHSGATLGDSEYSDTISFSLQSQIIYAWGRNYNGELGDGTTTNRSSPASLNVSKSDWKSVSAGRGISFAIDSSDVLYAWGSGILGDGNPSSQQTSPVTVVGNISDWSQVSAGPSTSNYALTSSGIIYAWGNNAFGQLGTNDTTSTLSPTEIAGGITDWIKVESEDQSVQALTASGKIYGWGKNAAPGRLGTNDLSEPSSYISPTEVAGNINDWIDVTVGDQISHGLRSNGELYSWGNSLYGQLGTNDATEFVGSPVLVAGAILDWEKITASYKSASTLALRSNGVLYAWGDNFNATLGDGTRTNRSSPVTVIGGITDWIDMTLTRDEAALALRSNGVLYAWGGNYDGSLGDGTTTRRSSPVTVLGGITDWIDIHGGRGHFLAIASE